MHFVCPLYSNTLAWAWLATDNSKWFPETPGNHPPLSMPNLTCMIHYWAFVWTSEHHSLKLIFLDFAQVSDFIPNEYLLLKSYWDYRVTPEMWVEKLFGQLLPTGGCFSGWLQVHWGCPRAQFLDHNCFY